MSTIVAGVDFGTLSVRVSIFDSEKGKLGAGVSEYPLCTASAKIRILPLRAMKTTCRRWRWPYSTRLKSAGIDGSEVQALALDTTGSSVIPVGRESGAAGRLLSVVRPPRLARSR